MSARRNKPTAETPTDLMPQLKAAAAAFEALSPVDKALHLAEQRRSFVRGQIGRDPGPDVLATEVIALRARVAEANRVHKDCYEAYCAYDARIADLTTSLNTAEGEALLFRRRVREVTLAVNRYFDDATQSTMFPHELFDALAAEMKEGE